MATNMPPHNLVEVISAARHLIKKPDATLDDLMRFVPGPDLPTGGKIIGLDGIREAYETGRGTFRTRATARFENVTARRKGIVVTELPLGVGPERVKEKIAELVRAKKVQGITAVDDYTDREKGLRLVIEVKNGFNPDAILEQLYRLTPIEDTFGINNVALVDGQPRTMGLKELLEVYVGHRLDVVRRRTTFRRRKAEDRLHLVDGLLVAILDIDEVIAVIRSSDDTAAARDRLMTVFDLSEIQTNYILEMPLRRLTKFSRIELEEEQDELRAEIAALTEILESDSLLRETVSERARRGREDVRHPAAHRAARVVGRAGQRHDGTARGHRRPLLGAAVLDRAAGQHGRRRAAAGGRRPGQARRARVLRAQQRPRRDRGRDQRRADDPARRARPADAAVDGAARPTCPVARRCRSSSRSSATRRCSASVRSTADRVGRAGARHRRGRGQAGDCRLSR